MSELTAVPPQAKGNRIRGSTRIRLFLGSTQGLAVIYLTAITLAEVITTIYEPRLGLVLHGLLLVGILLHATLFSRGKQQAFLLAQSLAPLVRIMSLSLPLRLFPFIFWYALVGAPLFLAALLTARVIGLGRAQIGLTAKSLPQQFLISLTGIGLGYLEYLILKPQPLSHDFSIQQIWLPALILLIFTGFLEEVIFRGVMYYVSLRSLGKLGIFYVSAIFAVLHIGYKSWLDLLFVFLVAVLFGIMALRSGSILGVTIAHGLTNIGLFLVFPFIVGLKPPPPTNLPDQAIAQYTLSARIQAYRPLLTATPSNTTTSTFYSTPSLTATLSPTLRIETPTGTASPTRNASATASPSISPSATPSASPGASSTISTTSTLLPSVTASIVSPTTTITPSPSIPVPSPSLSPTATLPKPTSDPNLIVIDDGDAGFTSKGGNRYLTEEGYGGDYLWANTAAQNITVEVTWSPSLSTCGLYQLDVFIPSGINLTHAAFYQIGHRKGMTGRLLDQAAYSGQWVTIGQYEFLPTSGSFLRLSNRTGEPAQPDIAIVFDAARWIYFGACSD